MEFWGFGALDLRSAMDLRICIIVVYGVQPSLLSCYRFMKTCSLQTHLNKEPGMLYKDSGTEPCDFPCKAAGNENSQGLRT